MIIVKIGGGQSINCAGIIKDLAELRQPLIIVHGANALRDQLAQQLNQPLQTITSVSNYASVYSDKALIDLMMMAYAGLKNKRLVELCQQAGLNAIGLSGLDGRVIQGRRNRGIRTRQNGKLKLVRDFSGKPQNVNQNLLQLLLNNGYTPVLTVPIIDETSCAINSENDEIVTLLQTTIKADLVLQFIEAPGFLENPDDETSLIKSMDQAELLKREAQARGRFKRKLLAIRKMLENGAVRVIIADGRVEHPVKEALNGKGTIIQ